MDSYKTPLGSDRSDDADLNRLLYRTGRVIKDFFVLIGRGIAYLVNAVVSFLLYLIRNLVWLVVGAGVGLAYGVYTVSKNGQQYTAQMTVRANFNSSRALYNKTDYLNSLINSSQKDKLSEIFGLTAKESAQLVSFFVEPVKTEMITAEIYRDKFMASDRVSLNRPDTFWVKTIKYEEFKQSLTNYDYPYHTILAKTSNPSLFAKLEPGIVKLVSGTKLLQQVKNRQVISNLDEEKLLVSAIQNLDTLRRAYNERLLKGQTAGSASNQLTVLETSPNIKTPELDLFDKMLELQDELKKSRKRFVVEQDILEVYSPFNPVGRKISFFDRVWESVLIGLILALIVLATIDFYRLAKKFRTKNQNG